MLRSFRTGKSLLQFLYHHPFLCGSLDMCRLVDHGSGHAHHFVFARQVGELGCLHHVCADQRIGDGQLVGQHHRVLVVRTCRCDKHLDVYWILHLGQDVEGLLGYLWLACRNQFECME